jgi:hypothetical protein
MIHFPSTDSVKSLFSSIWNAFSRIEQIDGEKILVRTIAFISLGNNKKEGRRIKYK